MINTLQIFINYLPKTQQWAFQLLKNTPNVVQNIAALRYEDNGFWENDFNKVLAKELTIIKKFYNKLRIRLLTRRNKKRFCTTVWEERIEHFIDTQLTPYIAKENIDLIHVHFANIGYQFLSLKQKFKSIPYIVSFYGMDYEYYPTKFPEYKDYYEKLYKEADAFICEGDHGKQLLIKNGVLSQKTFVVHLGIDASQISFFERKKKKESLKLLQVASYVEKKGHIYTIKAFQKALKSCPNMHLTLVGKPNELKQELEEYIVDHKMSKNVSFIDFIDYDKIHEFFKNFDAFIHPSCYTNMNDCEGGAPIVLLDAQATGLPVIATTHCDIPGEVIHETTGLLSKEKDHHELAKSISRFYLMDDIEYNHMSTAARKHVIDNFNVENCGLSLYEVYKNLIS